MKYIEDLYLPIGLCLFILQVQQTTKFIKTYKYILFTDNMLFFKQQKYHIQNFFFDELKHIQSMQPFSFTFQSMRYLSDCATY